MAWALAVGVKVRGIWGQSVGGPSQSSGKRPSRISVTQSTLRASRPGERPNDIGPWWALKFGASGVRASVARASPVARGQAEEV